MRGPILLGAALALLAPGAAMAGAANAGAGPAPPAAEDQLALSLSNELADIYLKRDLERLRKLLAPEYLGTAPGTNWDAEKLAAEFPRIEMQAARRLRYTVKPLAPGLLLLNEDVELYETYRDQDISGTYRMTTIWSERQGRWLLLFEQEVQLPPIQPPAAPPAGGT